MPFNRQYRAWLKETILLCSCIYREGLPLAFQAGYTPMETYQLGLSERYYG